MYSDNNLVYIFTILEAIEKISLYSEDFEDDEEFYNADDQLYFNAVVNLLIAIGEENKKIDDKIKNDFPFVWNEVSKMRDKMSHNYRGVSPFSVWDIVQNSLPKYKQLLIKILPNVNGYKEALEDALESEYYKHLKYLKLK
jgi:uncharacterized protein with HEPN domain